MIAIIPARGGSKGLLGKNIKLLNGLPLIAYSILEAKKSKQIEKVIVSTDSEEIAEISMKFGAEVPFLRPFELASDTALAIDNYIFTIEKLKELYKKDIHEIVVLQPTSPLRTMKDIDKAIEIYFKKNADSVISITEMTHPPIWAKKITETGIIKEYFGNDIGLKNRQEIEIAFIPNGAIFILKYSLLKDKYTYYSEKTFPYIMPNNRSVDIDTQYDFEYAEFLITKYYGTNNIS